MARKRKPKTIGNYSINYLRSASYKRKIERTERRGMEEREKERKSKNGYRSKLKGITLSAARENFPFIAKDKTMSQNMIVYTVPETLAYRFTQISYQMEDTVSKIMRISNQIFQDAKKRLDMVRNLCLEYEEPYKTISSNGNSVAQELQNIYDQTINDVQEIRKLYDDLVKFRAKDPGTSFKKKAKTPGVKRILQKADNLDEAVGAIVERLIQSIQQQLNGFEGQDIIRGRIEKRVRNLFKPNTKELKKANQDVNKAIEEVFTAEQIKTDINVAYNQLYRDFTKIAEDYKVAIEGLTSISSTDKNKLKRAVKNLADTGKKRMQAGNRKDALASMGFLHEYTELLTALYSKQLNPDVSLVQNASLNIYQKDLTTDLNLLIGKFDNLLKLGVSIKSNTENSFVKRSMDGRVRNNNIFSDAAFISNMVNSQKDNATLKEAEIVEQDFLRFITMSAATMHTLGVHIPPMVQSIVQNIRLAYIRIAYIKAILGAIMTAGNNKIDLKDAIEDSLSVRLTNFPVLVKIFDKFYWGSDMLEAGEKMLIDTTNVFNDHTSEESMRMMFNIKGLSSLANQLAAQDFRYRYLADTSLEKVKETDDKASKLINGSISSQKIMAAINELFMGNLRMFSIYSGNINVVIDMNKYLGGQ